MAGRTYPLALNYFWEQLKFQTYVPFSLMRFEQAQLTEGGKLIGTRKGTPLWAGSGTIIPMKQDLAGEISGRFSALRGVQGYFHAYDRRRVGPQEDPLGTLFASIHPTLTAINGTNDGITLNNMPNGFSVHNGDFCSAKMDDNTWTLHQFTQQTTVSSNVLTNALVEPNLPTGLDVGTEFFFYKAKATFKLQVGSYQEGESDGLFTSGIRASWIQVFEQDP